MRPLQGGCPHAADGEYLQIYKLSMEVEEADEAVEAHGDQLKFTGSTVAGLGWQPAMGVWALCEQSTTDSFYKSKTKRFVLCSLLRCKVFCLCYPRPRTQEARCWCCDRCSELQCQLETVVCIALERLKVYLGMRNEKEVKTFMATHWNGFSGIIDIGALSGTRTQGTHGHALEWFW